VVFLGKKKREPDRVFGSDLCAFSGVMAKIPLNLCFKWYLFKKNPILPENPVIKRYFFAGN
jgi:hypothetical protein